MERTVAWDAFCQRTKRLTLDPRLGRGDALEIAGGHERGRHSVARRQVQGLALARLTGRCL